MDQLVVFTFAFVSVLEIALPFAAAFWLAKKLGPSWKAFAAGALFFVVIQLVHAPVAVAVQSGFGAGVASQPLMLAALAAVLGLLAGLFEEVGRFLAFRHVFGRAGIRLDGRNAAMFGVGWGGIESAIVGALLIFTMFIYASLQPATPAYIAQVNASMNGTLTGEQAMLLSAQTQQLLSLSPLDLLPSLAERIMAMVLHVAWTMLVFLAAIQNRKKLLAVAIAWHAAVDFSTVLIAQLAGVYAAEASLLVFAVIAAYYIKNSWPEFMQAAESAPQQTGA
ncbi:MAG: YhfC family glutamic-type intramembrane protease [Candidatus ainarchaeum sp.]|nr:YhfC family glutamic-type intramembrane protease [Candidatus ainarchaeum sp.]